VTVLDPTNIATFEELQKIVLRLAPGRARTLPAHWTPGRQPVPALPIDEFITSFAERKRRPRLRSPHDLRCHRLGACPYAMARSGVAEAVEVAAMNGAAEDIKAFTTSKLKDLKNELPLLEPGLLSAFNHVRAIGSAQKRFQELDFSHLLNLEDRLIAVYLAIRDSMPQIEALHLERSQNRGNLWRQSFVGSLFSTWWSLTNSDPSSSSAPFLEFVSACWSSLSPDGLPEISWESAINSSLRRDSNSSWRREPSLPVADFA